MSEIDTTALDTVRALQRPGSPDLLGRIIGVFADTTPDGVKAIVEAAAAGDLETIRTAAHSIKSSAAYVGATRFSTRMADIERAARDEDLPTCRNLTVDIEAHFHVVLDELLALKDKAA